MDNSQPSRHRVVSTPNFFAAHQRRATIISLVLLVFLAVSLTWGPPEVKEGAQLFVQSLQQPAATGIARVVQRRGSHGLSRTVGSYFPTGDATDFTSPQHPVATISNLDSNAMVKALVAGTTICTILIATLISAVSRMHHNRADELLKDLEIPFAMASISSFEQRKVVVTGAGGRTGLQVVKKLLKMPEFQPVCIVRSQKSVDTLKKLGVPPGNIKVINVTDDPSALAEAFAGCDALILCTSAVPKVELLSIVKILVSKCFCRKPGRPTFHFVEGGSPEEVDWVGTKNQVDAAKAAGIGHFVMVSSMGGTQPDNFLNTMGKKSDGTGGNILLWKRKAERYLLDSGLKYTIVHPGGLVDKEGGRRQIVLGFDDTLLNEKVRSIPRADVAEICVQALVQPKAINRSIDVIAKPEGQGLPTIDFADFFSQKGTCNYNNL